MRELFIALAAAVVVPCLLWLFRRFLLLVVSAIQAKFARGHNLTGHWIATYVKRGQPREETAELHQILHRVWGATTQRDAPRRTFRIRGTLSANVLVATYEPQTKGPLDCGSFTLLVATESNTMNGRYSWMDSDTQAPESGEYAWRRT